MEAELYCYGNLVTRGYWTGVKISDLLNLTNADTTASSIEFTAQDGYKVAIPMETALLPTVILAYALDSNPLTETFRLVIPGANGNMWIAMVTSMTVSDAGANMITSTVSGPTINVNPNRFTQNTAQLSQNAQHTPAPTSTPSTPNPTPSIPATPMPTVPPTNTDTSHSPQAATQAVFPFEPAYLAVAAIMAALLLVSLVALKQKRHKTKP